MRSHDSPPLRSRQVLIDSYRPRRGPPSRRQSDIMPPPLSVARMAPLEDSTPQVDPPPADSELNGRQPSTAQSQVPLLDNLNAFAQSIKSAATLDVRRDLTKQQAVGQRRERERQSRQKSIFLTLIEDGDSKVEEAEKACLGIEKQIKISSQIQSRAATTLAAQLLKQSDGSNVFSSARDRTRLGDHLADVKADLKAVVKDVDSLKREAEMPGKLPNKLGDLATKDELRGLVDRDEIRELITKDELRRVTADEVHKHVTKALIPTEQQLASLILEDVSLDRKIDDVAAFTHKRRETSQEKDRETSSRLLHLETAVKVLQEELSRLRLTLQSTIEDQKRDYAAVMIDLGAQDKVLTDLNNHVRVDPSNDVPSLDNLVMKNSDHIQSLQQTYEKLNEGLGQIKDLQTASDLATSQVSQVPVNTVKKLEEEIKMIRSDLGSLKAEQTVLAPIRRDLDAFKAEQESVALIRTDLDSLIKEEKFKDAGVVEGFEKIEEIMMQQHQELARLDTAIKLFKQPQVSQPVANHPPTPPLVMSPRGSDRQKFQNLELEVKHLTENLEALRLCVDAQHQKFDGLRSDDLVRSMVHQMQLIYPNQPGLFVTWKTQVDQYIHGNLKENISNIYSKIHSTAETQDNYSSTINLLGQDNKELKEEVNGLRQNVVELRREIASCSPQDFPDHGTRVNEWIERATAIETMCVKAVSNLQAQQLDLIRDVTQLQHRDGISPTKRSSRSNEPDRTPIVSSKGSDSSDTPISRRADRGVRDGKGGSPNNPNLKRKATGSHDEDENGGGEARDMTARKVPKRRNVSGHNPFM